MDEIGIAICLIIFGFLALPAGWLILQFRRVQNAKKWPSTEGMIQSGEIEVMPTSSMRGLLKLPVFAFSYLVDSEYYSGRFTLVPNIASGEDLVKLIVNRKIKVQYDPDCPSAYYLPYEQIEGGDVKQKLDPRLFRNYATE